jgi:hypothetical protein
MINVANLRFSAPRANTSGSKTIYINYESGRLTVQTPMMILPYGIGDWNKEGDPKKYDLNVSFRGASENPRIQAFKDKMIEVESYILDQAVKNAKDMTIDPKNKWFAKAYTREMLEEFFTPIIRTNTDKTGAELPETMKIKLPYDNNTDTFSFEAFDMDENTLDFKSLMMKLKGAKAQLIIQLTGLWMVGTKFGCTWKVLTGKFDVPTMAPNKFTFRKDDDDEDVTLDHDEDLEEDAMHAAVTHPVKKRPMTAAPAVVPESEPEEEEEEELVEEELEEEEEELPPPPPPPPAKKTVVKKAVAKK